MLDEKISNYRQQFFPDDENFDAIGQVNHSFNEPSIRNIQISCQTRSKKLQLW